MKLLKLSLVAILIALILVSCGSDNSTDLDDDKEVEEPTGKITLVTTIDGEERERRVIESKGNVTTPINYEVSGFYTNANDLFSFNVIGLSPAENNFKFNFNAFLDELENGNYSFVAEDGILDLLNYSNDKFGEGQYRGVTANLIITNVKYIAITEIVGNYFITGYFNAEFENDNNENPNVSVYAEFVDMRINKSITGF